MKLNLYPSASKDQRQREDLPSIITHYLKKEKELSSVVKKILPKPIADSLIQKGSRLAHLYGLPKTHKTNLVVHPILSATVAYNYKLAKWLDEKLKPLSVNDHTINDIFSFADENR